MVVTTTVKFSRITFLTKFPIKYQKMYQKKKKKKIEFMFNQFFFLFQALN